MPNLKILVWKDKEGRGDPEVEVKVPLSLAKWVPRMMKFIPKTTKEETWGHDIDFEEMFADIDALAKEVVDSGQPELMDVKTADAHVKILIEK